MVIEFVLYDIVYVRKSVIVEEDEIFNEGFGKENVELDDLFDVIKFRRIIISVNDYNSVDFLIFYLWVLVDLYLSFEIVFIVV